MNIQGARQKKTIVLSMAPVAFKYGENSERERRGEKEKAELEEGKI